MTMHVLYVIDSLVPGGAETSLAAIAPHLVRAGLNLEVCSLSSQPGLQQRVRRAVPVSEHDVDTRRGAIAAVRDVVRSSRPDLIHTTLFEADIAGRIAGVITRTPVVSTLARLSYGPDHRAEPGAGTARLLAAQAVDALTARAVTRFHAVSAVVADGMSGRLAVRRDRIDVVWRGRDRASLGQPGDVRRELVRRDLGVAGDQLLLLVAARHEFQKGIDVAIRAAAIAAGSNPDLLLLIAGRSGNATASLVDLTRELRLEGHVRFLGQREDIPDLVCAADAVLMPSRGEGLPGMALEAMALDTPAITSDIEPFQEALGDERCGWIVPTDDHQQLALAIERVIHDRGEVSRRTLAARERFEDFFTIERAAAGMMEFYNRSFEGR